jgi:hypothetical protein
MQNYVVAAIMIEETINSTEPGSFEEACQQLDMFWRTYCEVTIDVLWLVCYTRHNHAAKSTWARLDYMLSQRLRNSTK